MTTTPAPRMRASDAEREDVVKIIQQAGGDGRLTLDEVEQRMTAIYATKFRDELAEFTADLPSGQHAPNRPVTWTGHRVPRPLVVHATIVAVLAIVLLARWAVGPVLFFWPAFPMFWLAMSLVIHARARAGWNGRRWSPR